MKNIHLIPTDKPSELYAKNAKLKLYSSTMAMDWYISEGYKPHHIYITSDKEIKEGDWLFDLDIKRIVKADSLKVDTSKAYGCWYYKKIILTTDQDLIKDGVQAIDDTFLEWFVKNPSCESVEVFKDFFQVNQNNPVLKGSTALVESYKIIIPQEEPLQKTLEKAVKGNTLDLGLLEIELNHTKTLLASCEKALKDRDKQSERMYSEEEVEIIIQKLMNDVHCGDLCYGDNVIDFKKSPRQWFEQFKKK
jgi:hypothetical protein